MKLWTVDAFTNTPFKGNPAAVMIVDDFPSDSLCQNIAAEMNLSETAFVKPIKANHFHIRWFTPKVEVKLCGHATLATAHILYTEKYLTQQEILFESLSGNLQVHCAYPNYTLDFPLQKTGKNLPDLKPFFETALEIVQAYDDIIVELAAEEDVRNYRPNFEVLLQIPCRGIIITAKAQTPYDFISRFFAPKVGVKEDPVTGSAHCKLADYWAKKLEKTTLFAYQASSRGGQISLVLKKDRVHLTGQACTIIKGDIDVEMISG